MKLTQQQITFFNTFGYLAFDNLFSTDEMEWITEDFETSIQEFGGKNHDGSKRTFFGGPIEHRPRLCALLDDPRILGVARGVLGEDFNYAGGGQLLHGGHRLASRRQLGTVVFMQDCLLPRPVDPRHRLFARHPRQSKSEPFSPNGADRSEPVDGTFRCATA